MSGTRHGGLWAADTNRELYGADFYKRIGKLGGQVKSPLKGFGSMTLEQRSAAGRKGGAISKRGPSRPKEEPQAERFFIEDETINDHIIEAFQPTPWYKGWIRFNKEK